MTDMLITLVGNHPILVGLAMILAFAVISRLIELPVAIMRRLRGLPDEDHCEHCELIEELAERLSTLERDAETVDLVERGRWT